jgi:hypothetical protein
MSYTKPRKRPCSICRKWFLPDVRQAGRQKTCGSECSAELHRRNCAEWNRKNAACFKSSYLARKIEEDGRSPPNPARPDVRADPGRASRTRINLNLPRDTIGSRIGVGNLIVAEYVIEQIFGRIRGSTGFAQKVIQSGFQDASVT